MPNTNTHQGSPDEPSPSYLQKIEKMTGDSIRKALGIPEKPDEEKIQPLTPTQRQQLQEIEERAIAQYRGDLDQLEAAIGMLRLGHHLGWKVLYIYHSKRTIRNYEKILGIEVRELFAPEGPSAYRSIGYVLAGKFKNFWKVVSGETKIPHKQGIE